MTVSSSLVRFNVDAELALRAEGLPNITADAASDPLSLDRLSAYWNAGEIATPQQFAIFGSVSALDATTGDETYDIEVQVDSDTTFGSPVVIKTVRVTKLGLFVIPSVREQLEAVADAAFLRLNVDVAGTTPIFNYYAYATSYQGR